jgi:hypothetical protein
MTTLLEQVHELTLGMLFAFVLGVFIQVTPTSGPGSMLLPEKFPTT